MNFSLKRGLSIAPSKVDKSGHGAYLSAKAWNSRVLLEWLNDCALRASPLSGTFLHMLILD